MFKFYVQKFQRDGFLDAADQRDLEHHATDQPLDPGLETDLRLYGATEALAARLIGERSRAFFDAVARAIEHSKGLPLGETGARFLSDLRMLPGTAPADIAEALRCGRDWHDVADAIERLHAPKPSRRVA